MRSHWFSIVTLVAALTIGYSVLSSREGAGLDGASEPPVLLGYYLRDAIITETAEDGAPRARFAASEVSEQPEENRVVMTAVRADYVWAAATDGPQAPTNRAQRNHWVLNADTAYLPMPPTATTATTDETADETADAPQPATARVVELRGDVEAYSVGAQHDAMVQTQALDIDTDAQIARSPADVLILVDGHSARGSQLMVDMQRNRVQLQDGVSALVTQRDQQRAREESDSPALALPDLFEWDRFEYDAGVLEITNVRSKSEPYISADRARASGADLENNQILLSGSVRLELPKRGLVEADSATMTVRNNRIVRAEVNGAPVKFQHEDKAGRIVHGSANKLEYDVQTQILRFTGQPSFNNNQFEIKSDPIEYNLATESARGGRSEGTLLRDRRATQTPQ